MYTDKIAIRLLGPSHCYALGGTKEKAIIGRGECPFGFSESEIPIDTIQK